MLLFFYPIHHVKSGSSFYSIWVNDLINHILVQQSPIQFNLTTEQQLEQTITFFLSGRRKIAQGIIKEHFGHVTPNRVCSIWEPFVPSLWVFTMSESEYIVTAAKLLEISEHCFHCIFKHFFLDKKWLENTC